MKNIVTNKSFWNFIGPFLINKGSLNSCEVMIRKENKIITGTKEIVQVLNDHYNNIVQRSLGEKPASIEKQSYLTDDIKIFDHIIRHYEDHSSERRIIITLKHPQNSTFSLLTISEQEVKKILKGLSKEKSTGVVMITPKLVKLAVNYLARPLSQSFNNSIKKGLFLE